jgi:hypothetical protein
MRARTGLLLHCPAHSLSNGAHRTIRPAGETRPVAWGLLRQYGTRGGAGARHGNRAEAWAERGQARASDAIRAGKNLS